jgi:hypothetical protein
MKVHFIINQEIQTEGKLKAHKNKSYDTIKIYHEAHSFKSDHLVINFLDDDSKILKEDETLSQGGVKEETELSVFTLSEYKEYKENPKVKW